MIQKQIPNGVFLIHGKVYVQDPNNYSLIEAASSILFSQKGTERLPRKTKKNAKKKLGVTTRSISVLKSILKLQPNNFEINDLPY